MTSRAALLPHPADPFLFKYWLKYFDTYWQSEIDKLYILVNSPMEYDVIKYMQSLVADNPKIVFSYYGYQIDHGKAIDMMLDECKEDLVMLVEDDGIIFKHGLVDKYFSVIENDQFDVVGSPRGSCAMEIYEAARLRFGLTYEGVGDHGPNFWPNFFFTRRNILLQTDRNFCGKAWKRGETIEPLDYVVKDEIAYSDTFVNTSLQLRNMGLRILEIPQYHGNTDDFSDFERRQNLFDGECGWIHIGSLSSGTHGVLTDSEGRCLARRLIDPPKNEGVLQRATTLQEQLEWERRASFWQLFIENADPESIPEFYELYKRAVDSIIQEYGLSTERIEKRKEAYRSIGL